MHFQMYTLKKCIFKITLQRKYFQIYSQKIHFRDCSLKITLLQNTSLKLLPQKIHSQNCSLKKYFFKKYIFKNEKVLFKISLSNKTFSNLLSQKLIFKIVLSKFLS